MQVRMLTGMAGDSFSYHAGETVTVPDAVGEAWKAAGLAETPPRAEAAERAAKDLRAQVQDLTARLAESEADRDALRHQVEALAAQLAATAPAP
ncbi:hypothetical protein LRS73_17950 [Methylobacterium currus]|uniref:hypothetical protein n=1 Tax=Methylobacterium currus TaxID=2051553 RepID=UPI001E3488F2|nr:hypothetical protein [Methylobacterium currus]UHC14432.1 hypothetical protein LRS73_17950 [Methylobacterium currus]